MLTVLRRAHLWVRGRGRGELASSKPGHGKWPGDSRSMAAARTDSRRRSAGRGASRRRAHQVAGIIATTLCGVVVWETLAAGFAQRGNRCHRRRTPALAGVGLARRAFTPAADGDCSDRAATTALAEAPQQLFLDDWGRGFEELSLPRWQMCSVVEGTTCSCTGTVSFHTWAGDWSMQRHVNGSIQCTAEAFGDDPRPHFKKFCSCLSGPIWHTSVVEGLNATFSRGLVPRIEIGPATAGCGQEDDGLWVPCAIMNTRFDSSILPDRMLSRMRAEEQEDALLRKLDNCYHIGGSRQALRVLGVDVSAADRPMLPMKAVSAPVCAVVYAPERGPAWNGREAIFCPTLPQCITEETCECANKDHGRINVKEGEEGPACWACAPQEAKASAKPTGQQQQEKQRVRAPTAAAAAGSRER